MTYYPNQGSSGTITMDSNGIYHFGQSTIRKVTSIEREFDEDGRVVKETETITEYVDTPSYPAYPYPYQPTWAKPVESRVTN
jgi:hypothetical protein